MLKIGLIIISLLYTGLNAPLYAADLDGYKTPGEAVNAFLNPLKKGISGLKESTQVVQSLNGESFDYVNKSLNAPKYGQAGGVVDELSQNLKDGGKLIKTKEIDSYSRLQGKQQSITYEMEFNNGKKRQVLIKLLQPTATGGYHIVDVILDP